MLIPLALLIPALLAMALASAVARADQARLASLGTTALSVVGLLLTLAWVAAGAEAETLTLPIGLPGSPVRLVIDPLTAPFLGILFGVASLAFLFAHGYAGTSRARDPIAPFGPCFVAAMLLALLAGDAFTLVAGFEGMSLLSWPLVVGRGEHDENREAGRLYLGVAAIGGACLIPALGLLAASAGSLEFARIRVSPPEGWQAGLLFWLVLFGAGSKAGLVPLHPWLPPAHAAAPSHASALMSGAMTKVAIYVLVRLLFDLAGPAQPWWWGGVLMGVGAASMLLGAIRAVVETDLKLVLAASTIENLGLIAICVGLAMAFRGSDASTYAALALGAALLHAVNHGAFKSLLFLCAGGVLAVAHTRSLDRLGGLLLRAPGLGACALIGCLAAASLPPLNGFASEWLAFQAVLVAPRQGSLAFQITASVVAGVMALAVAVAAAGFVRLFGVAFLSRPRSNDAADAQDLSGTMLASLAIATLLCFTLGFLPRLPLLLIDPGVRALTGVSVASQAGWLAVVAPGSTGGGYAPLLLGLLLLVFGGMVHTALRLARPGSVRRSPLWACGFVPPNPHDPLPMPFAQTGAAGFGQPLRRIFGTMLLQARETVRMPEPGSGLPARFEASRSDPSLSRLFAPAGRILDLLADQVNRLRFLTIRQHLVLLFAWLVTLLAGLAALAEV